MMGDKIMECSWAVVDKTGDRFAFKSTLFAIEAAHEACESGLLIGHCKSLIESFSKTILDEKKVTYSPDSSVGRVVKAAVNSLGVAEGVENEKKAREAFLKLVTSTAQQFEVAALSIGELRNDFCPLSHGRSITHVPLDMSHAVFVAKLSDATLGFIFDLYENHNLLKKPEISFTDNKDFNEYLDDSFGSFSIYGDDYLASEILFEMNPKKYKEAFEEFQSTDDVEGTST